MAPLADIAKTKDETAKLPSALWGLLGVVFIDALSYSMIMPLLPFLVLEAGGDAWWGGLIATIHALAAAIAAPFLGALSDRFGRRTLLLTTAIGALIAYGLLIVSTSIGALLAVRALSGAMAGNLGIVSAGIADVTSEEQRARGMTLSSAAWSLGFVVGPGLAAVLSGLGGTPLMLAPAAVAAGATLISFVFVALTVPDAKPLQAREAAPERESQDVETEIVLLGYLTALAVSMSGLVSMAGFWAASAHNWGPKQVSLLLLWSSLCIVALQVLLVVRLARRYGELNTLVFGLVLTLIGCGALIAAPHSVAVVIVAAPLIFAGITIGQTMANTRLTRLSSEHRGARMGRATAASSLGRVVGPTAGGAVFVGFGPLAIFGAVMGVSAVLLLTRLFAREGAADDKPGAP
jgi:predicted MFS family arabinose efflux permease